MDPQQDPPQSASPAATPESRRGGTRRSDKRQSHSTLRNTVEWVAVIAGAVVIALLVRNFVVQSYQIPSGSMEETLMIDDRVLVNHLSYRLHDVNRGDVIVFSRPDGTKARPDDPDDLIKRAIGLPGETIQAIDGVVHIDGEPLDEPYLGPGTATFGLDEPVEVPEGEVFVLGDNRGNSDDSRFIGTIPTDTVKGRAFAIIWPLSRFSGL